MTNVIDLVPEEIREKLRKEKIRKDFEDFIYRMVEYHGVSTDQKVWELLKIKTEILDTLTAIAYNKEIEGDG